MVYKGNVTKFPPMTSTLSGFLLQRLLMACTLVLALWPEVRAAEVYSQPASGTGALLPSSRYAPDGTDYDQYVWESFSVPTAQAITEIRWRGGHIPAYSYWGGSVSTFRVSIYGSTPGLSQPHLGPQYPASPAFLATYDTGGTAGETLAGTFGGAALYDYRFTLPTVFQAAAGMLYWVQIEAEQVGGIPDWGIATATGGNGSHFRRIPGQADYYFQYAPGDAAITLLSSDGPVRTIAVTASPAEGGSVENAGLYPDGSAAPLLALPNPGFAFLNWSENGAVVSAAPAYTFTVSGDRALVANFAAGSAITTLAVPETGGTTQGDGSHVDGSPVTVEAAPSANYVFVNWTENGVPVSTSAAYTFTAGGDRDLVANFTPSATNVGLVFNQPPTTSGTLLPSAFLTPDGIDGEHYAFEKFNLGTTEAISRVSWRGGYTGNNSAANPVVGFVIKIYGSTANGFYPDLANPVLKKYTINSNAGQTPSVLAGGVQMFDYTVTLPTSFTATGGVPYWIQIEASQAVYPIGWGFATGAGGNGAHYRKTTGGNYTSQSGDLALSLGAAVPTRHDIAAAPSNASGTVSGPGSYAHGAPVVLLASPVAGHALVNWTEDGVIVSTAATYAFTATAGRSLTAHFAPSFTLSLISSSTLMGTVSGGGTYVTGTTVTATATPKPGYVFLRWTENGSPVGTAASHSFTLAAAKTLTAVFAAGFNVTATPSLPEGGTVSGSGGYGTGTTATLSATPAPGYRFTGWTENGAPAGFEPTVSVTASSARNLVALFELIIPVVATASTAGDGLSLEWPADLPGWQLQESADLVTWVNSSAATADTGNRRTATVPQPLPGQPAYYRLAHP